MTAATSPPRDRLCEAVLTHLLGGGTPNASLRTLASAVGVSHTLLLYHFGSVDGLLSDVQHRCEQRERDHVGALRVEGGDPARLMRTMWRHLADPAMWPVYRLGFALRVRTEATSGPHPGELAEWSATLAPVLAAAGVPTRARHSEALLWVATCRGLLWELVTGTDPRDVERAAERFFVRYEQTR